MLIHPTGQFDNQSVDYKHIHALPLAAAMGAEISGIRLAELSDEALEEIRHALYRHKMVYFRDQELTHADQHALSLRLGRFAEDAYTDGVPGYREVQPLIREADVKDDHLFGSGWHSDSPFVAEPPHITMLYGVELPPFGGDTQWANTVLAYNTLSDTMKGLISNLSVRMSMKEVLQSTFEYAEPGEGIVGRLAALKNAGELPPAIQEKVIGTVHPLVRKHPESGELALFCDPSYSIGIEGMTPPESKALLDMLNAHLTQPAFTCRLKWAPRTFAMWDNRICVHQAFNDYSGFRRELYRTIVLESQAQ